MDKNDNLLIDNVPKKNTVVSPEVAYIMSDILRTTVANGIAGRAQIPNMTTAGKTGTTQDKADAWFVGFTPYYVTGVWIGNDSPQIKLNQGSSMAAQLWKIIMTRIHDGLENKKFEQPANIVSVSVCSQSGKLPTELCKHDPRGSSIITEIFVQGTQPIEFCETHVEVEIDTTTGKIANEYCPKEHVSTKIFIKRDPPYNPKEHKGIVPADYQYTVPTEICDVHDEKNTIKDDPEDKEEDEDEKKPEEDEKKPEDDEKKPEEDEKKPEDDEKKPEDDEKKP